MYTRTRYRLDCQYRYYLTKGLFTRECAGPRHHHHHLPTNQPAVCDVDLLRHRSLILLSLHGLPEFPAPAHPTDTCKNQPLRRAGPLCSCPIHSNTTKQRTLIILLVRAHLGGRTVLSCFLRTVLYRPQVSGHWLLLPFRRVVFKSRVTLVLFTIRACRLPAVPRLSGREDLHILCGQIQQSEVLSLKA